MRGYRIDTTQSALVEYARALGADWLPWPGGPVDGFFWYRGRLIMVEFKTALSKAGRVKLTKTQHELIQRRWPIAVVADEGQLRAAMEGV